MKLQNNIICFFSAAIIFSAMFSGCKTGSDEEAPSQNGITEIIEEKTSSFGSDKVYTSSDFYNGNPILKITAKNSGFLIEKNTSDTWTHNTIHVRNLTTGKENFKIDNVNETTNTILYPYVKAGNEYEIWIEKQETIGNADWQNWGESNKVSVVAKGGEGNLAVYYDDFVYNPSTHVITFKGLTYVHPESVKIENMSLSGPVFNGKPWSAGVKENYSTEYTRTGNEIKISGAALSVLDSEKKNGIDLSTGININGLNFRATILSGLFYAKSDTPELKLNGGIKLPEVYITSSNISKSDLAFHAGDNWTDAKIKIVDANNGLSETAVKIKDRGNSTKWTEKVPYSLKFEEKTKVLGMAKSKRWVLMANYFDRSLIRTDFAGYLGNNVFNSCWNASFTPVNLYINGTFVGTYDLGESNKVEKNRVNVQSLEDYADGKSTFADVNGDGIVDIQDAGFMVEIDTNIWGERFHFNSEVYAIPFNLKDPDFGDYALYSNEQCAEYLEYASSKINDFENMLAASDFEQHYNDYIDETSFVDWYLINEFAKNSDANFQKSVPVVYNAATGKLSMGPNWDFDLGFGNFDHDYNLISGGSNTVNNPEGWYIHGGKKYCDENSVYIENKGYYVQSWWINRLFESSSFKKAVKNRWMEKRSSLKKAIENQIVNYANMIKDSIPENEKRLPRIGKYSWNGPGDYLLRKTYEAEVTYLYDWCLSRYNWMDKEISKW